MTFSPVTQMIVFWTTNLVFLLYLLIYRPLKEKWMRILTLIIEVLIHSYITIGFIIGIVDPFADIDGCSNTRRNRIRFSLPEYAINLCRSITQLDSSLRFPLSQLNSDVELITLLLHGQ